MISRGGMRMRKREKWKGIKKGCYKVEQKKKDGRKEGKDTEMKTMGKCA